MYSRGVGNQYLDHCKIAQLILEHVTNRSKWKIINQTK